MKEVFRIKKILQGRLKKGDDLYNRLLEIIKENNIRAGLITGIGAVSKVTIGYFNQEKREYEQTTIEEGLEILNMHGNVSFKDGEPFIHVHIMLGRKDLTALGGHLLPNTTVYACEYEIVELEGTPFHRSFDDETGLYLWTP